MLRGNFHGPRFGSGDRDKPPLINPLPMAGQFVVASGVIVVSGLAPRWAAKQPQSASTQWIRYSSPTGFGAASPPNAGQARSPQKARPPQEACLPHEAVCSHKPVHHRKPACHNKPAHHRKQLSTKSPACYKALFPAYKRAIRPDTKCPTSLNPGVDECPGVTSESMKASSSAEIFTSSAPM